MAAFGRRLALADGLLAANLSRSDLRAALVPAPRPRASPIGFASAVFSRALERRGDCHNLLHLEHVKLPMRAAPQPSMSALRVKRTQELGEDSNDLPPTG